MAAPTGGAGHLKSGGAPTQSGYDAKAAARKRALAKAAVSAAKAAGTARAGTKGTGTGGGTHAPVNLPQLAYTKGPFELPIVDYEFRLWVHSSDGQELIPMEEIEGLTWNDASALATGTVTFREPSWARRLNVQAGDQITCDVRETDGTWQQLWIMRCSSPGIDYSNRQRTFQLVNELQRLMDSTDSYSYVKDKKSRPKGWRVDDAIRAIFDAYEIPVASDGIPAMKTLVTNWTPQPSQSPFAVIKTLILREKNATGVKYSLRLDAQGRAVISRFARPRQLYAMGKMLIAATYAVQRNDHFATQVSIRSDPITLTGTDLTGKTKNVRSNVLAVVESKKGREQFGLVHRDEYSPDAKTRKDAETEGKYFLASVGRNEPLLGHAAGDAVPAPSRRGAVRVAGERAEPAGVRDRRGARGERRQLRDDLDVDGR
jgi:hypothetical protein